VTRGVENRHLPCIDRRFREDTRLADQTWACFLRKDEKSMGV
jgi:hypothetical protein